MILLWLVACSSGGSPGDDSAPEFDWPCTATTLAYDDLAAGWGLVDTTDDEPYPDDGSGVAMADLDEDGFDDIVIGVRTTATVINWNRHDHFEQQTLDLGMPGGNVAAVDVDGDHHLDLLVSGTREGQAIPDFKLLRGDGAGGFSAAETLPTPFGPVLAIDAADYDHDGDLDLYMTSTGPGELLVNDGAGVFTAMGQALLDVDSWSRGSWIGLWIDTNNDGWQDLIVGKDLQTELGETRLYANDHGTLTQTTAPLTVNAMGGSVLDYNGDGLLDVFISGTGGNGLYANDGAGGWYDVAVATGAQGDYTMGQMTLGSLGFDADNDGRVDIATAGGRFANDETLLAGQDPVEPDSLLLNLGDTFEAVAADVGFGDDADGKSVVGGDLDGDGTIELVVTQTGFPSHVYRTACTANYSVDVELYALDANAYGIGARVEAHTSDGDLRGWVRLLQGLDAVGPPRAHIGLGGAALQGLTVYWPDGNVQDVDVQVPGRITVYEEAQ